MEQLEATEITDRVLVNASTGVRIRIVRSGAQTAGRLLELEATYPPHSSEPPPHLHPRQDEEFVIVSGSMMVRLVGKVSQLRAGEVISIPKGTPHSMWNAGEEPTTVIWRTTPALNTEHFFRDVYWLASEGRTNSRGTPDLLDLAWLVPQYWNEIRITRPPELVQRLLFAILAPVAYFRRRRSLVTGPNSL